MEMSTEKGHTMCYPQSTVHNSQFYYKRISGRLKKIELNPSNVLPQVSINKFSKDSKCRYYPRFYPYFTGGLIVFLLCTFLAYSIFPYPLHASCTVQWNFREPCNHVIQRLRWQILKWSSCYNCRSRGSRCLYSVIKLKLKESMNNNSITASHISPNFQVNDNIRISFAEGSENSCIATGESKSNQWFMIFDGGSNYCNLRNLIEGANLISDPGFSELTTNSICTQFNMAVCK